ncbi:MAG: thioredoxin family protein [Kofleriaceae bacterium]|nr:thioredoxin family protein [Kofleriaceae bacterium]
MEPTRDEIDSLRGLALLEFGASWCGFCQAARPVIDRALAGSSARHIQIEDGKGKRLGRSFGVKLWPTLIVLRDGREVARFVRPHDGADLEAALHAAA